MWSDEMKARLRTLWEGGYSASQIARMLHAEGHPAKTRNAVIGVVSRLGLQHRTMASAQHHGRMKRIAKVRANVREPVARKSAPRKEPARFFVTPASDRATIHSILALRDATDTHPGDCRWPVGDPQDASFGYCGAPKAVGSYCACHAARAFDVRPPKRKTLRPFSDTPVRHPSYGWRVVL